MFRRRHFLILICIPLVSMIVTWVFCLQEDLQQVGQANILLEESLQALEEKLDRFDKEEKKEALLGAKSESEKIQETVPSEPDETFGGDSLLEIVHIVKAGETLYAVGMKYGVSCATLVKHNSLQRPDTIYAGQKLRIPLSQAGIATPTSIDGTPIGREEIGLLGVDLDSYRNYIIRLKHWFAEFFSS